MKNKYRAIPTTVDGIKFASKREAARYSELKLLERAGAIRGLAVHPSWPMAVNGKKIGRYTADFMYAERLSDGEYSDVIIEDVKSKASKTEAYGLRKKLMLAIYGIEIKEIF